MARITVEDCLQNVDNIFQLVLLASQRARRLANGAESTVPWENDKPTVVALREIAAGNIAADLSEFDENEQVKVQAGAGDVPPSVDELLPPSADDLPPEA